MPCLYRLTKSHQIPFNPARSSGGTPGRVSRIDSCERHHSATDCPPRRVEGIRLSRGSDDGVRPSWLALRRFRWLFRKSPIRRMLELALIENIQREDLNPIETAHAYDRLGRELGLSQEEIGAENREGSQFNHEHDSTLAASRRSPAPSGRAPLSPWVTPGRFWRCDSAEEQIRLAEKAVSARTVSAPSGGAGPRGDLRATPSGQERARRRPRPRIPMSRRQ